MNTEERTASPTPGPYYSGPGTTTIWSGNGSVRIADCRSPHLNTDGNAANAQYLARCTALPGLLRRAEATLRAQGIVGRQHSARPIEELQFDLQRALVELGDVA